MRSVPHRYPLTIAVVAACALIGIATLLFPGAVETFGRKEGLGEQLSHALLVAAIVVWAISARQRPRWLGVVVAMMCCMVLAEEIDWGEPYGLVAIGGWIRGRVNTPNLHNAWGGASYLLFGLPWLLLYAPAFAPERWTRRLGGSLRARLPPRDHSIALGWIIVSSVMIAVVAPPHWERVFDELWEFLFYGVVFASGLSTSVKS